MKNAREAAIRDLHPTSSLVGQQLCLRLFLVETFAQLRFAAE